MGRERGAGWRRPVPPLHDGETGGAEGRDADGTRLPPPQPQVEVASSPDLPPSGTGQPQG